MTQSIPILSIVIPVYNIENYISECLDSIVAQTYCDYEVIIVDDGSKDRTGIICDEYSRRDKRIKVIHQENKGVSAARNTALDIVRGKYLTFIDGDDRFGTPTTLWDNIQFLLGNESIDIIQFPFYSICKGNSIVPDGFLEKRNALKLLITTEFNAGLWGKIFKSKLFENIRLPLGMKMCEDLYCLIDLINLSNSIYISSKGCYVYNMRNDSATHTMTPEKWFDVFHANYKLLTEYSKIIDELDSNYIKVYFDTLNSLLITRIAFKNSINAKSYQLSLKKHIPKFKCLFNKDNWNKTKKTYRLWLFIIYLLGLNTFSDLYVNYVLSKIK